MKKILKYVVVDIVQNKIVMVYTLLLLIISLSVFNLESNSSKGLLKPAQYHPYSCTTYLYYFFYHLHLQQFRIYRIAGESATETANDLAIIIFGFSYLIMHRIFHRNRHPGLTLSCRSYWYHHDHFRAFPHSSLCKYCDVSRRPYPR